MAKHNRIPEEVLAWMHEHAEGSGKSMREVQRELNAHFGTDRTLISVKSICKNHKICTGGTKGNKTGTHMKYPREIAEYLAVLYRERPIAECVAPVNERFGTDFNAARLVNYAKRNGVRSGRTGRFEKGVYMASRHMKHPGFRNSGTFTAGHVPPNLKPVGTVTVRGKNQELGKFRKLPDGSWRSEALCVWEDHNGPVKDGHCIIFLDGDIMNTDISNLREIPRRIHGPLNSSHARKGSPEIVETRILVAKLKVARNDRLKSIGKHRRETPKEAE